MSEAPPGPENQVSPGPVGGDDARAGADPRVAPEQSAPPPPPAAASPSSAPASPPPPGVPGPSSASAAGGWQASASYGQPSAAWAGSTAASQAPARPRIPVRASDLVRDAVAAVLLLISLMLPWDVVGGWAADGRSRPLIEVLLVTLVAVASVIVPYLAHAGVFGPTWTPRYTRWLRAGLNVPFVIVVVLEFILRLLDDDSVLGASVGTGAALGLAGALLAAQPRAHEIDSQQAKDQTARAAVTALTVLGALIVLGYLGSLVWFIRDLAMDSSARDILGAADDVGLVLGCIGAAVLALLPVVGTAVARSLACRRALMTVGVGLVIIFVFGADSGSTLPTAETLHLSSAIGGIVPWSMLVGLGSTLVPAAAAVASSVELRRLMRPVDAVRGWVHTASVLLWLLGTLAALTVIAAASFLSSDVMSYFRTGGATAAAITTIILAVAVGVAAVLAALQLRAEAVAAQRAALGAAAVALVLGIVIMVLAPAAFSTGGSQLGHFVTAGHLMLAFGLPVGIALALLVPKPVRDTFAGLRAARAPRVATTSAPPPPMPQEAAAFGESTPPEGPTPPAPDVPVMDRGVSPEAEASPPPAPPAPPAHGFTRQVAQDPRTPAATLAAIVENAPELRAAVAANPATYPALLDWLALVHDPEIDAALAARRS